MATAKKTVSKPVPKKAPAKAAPKTAPAAPKNAVTKNKTVVKATATSSNKKASPAPASKKPAPVKAPAKKSTVLTKTTSKSPVTTKKTEVKAAPAKKAAAPAKSNVVAKPVAKKAEVPVKVASKAPVKAAPPVKKAEAPAPVKKAVPTAPAPAAKKATVVPPVKATAKSVTAKAPVKAPAKVIAAAIAAKQGPLPKPSPAPAAYIGREEKKNNVIIAHRRLESKANTQEEESGKTMINYQPDFTRSILSPQTEEKTGPVYRYSDEELAEFKELIQNRLETARKELAYQQGLITRKDEAGTEDTENRYMNMEDGSGAMEREQLAQLASRQIQFINHLEKALIRIENKTYGICRVTGNLIDKARLRAVPHATLSIEAKKQMNK